MVRKKTMTAGLSFGLGIAVLFLSVGLFPVDLRSADEIKLGLLSTGGDHWPIWVTEDQGYFNEQKLDIRQFHTDSIAKAVQALSANSTDLIVSHERSGRDRRDGKECSR